MTADSHTDLKETAGTFKSGPGISSLTARIRDVVLDWADPFRDHGDEFHASVHGPLVDSVVAAVEPLLSAYRDVAGAAITEANNHRELFDFPPAECCGLCAAVERLHGAANA